ncbi:MAG TPA: efflux RND transporter permease subunit [Longimicrobiaceae bacterium]|nr:efflux RND transporter permease subunit [Longimicrobiaceae bacterium]
MWISDFAIRRPIITIVTMLALVVFGAFALFNLDTDEFPEVNPPVVSVAIPYPGASPDVVEREVVEPIEEAISAISGIDRINSQSLDGFGIIIAEFDFEKDLQQATQDIRDGISQIRGDLPTEMEEPILTRFDPQDLPIVSLTLTSERLGAAELTRLADPGITRELRGIPGVAEVEVVGGLERELVVELRPQAMQAAGISVGQVVQAIQAQNLAVPVGRLEGSLDERTIRLRGRLDTPEDFTRLVVAQQGGRIVRLGEVAAVRDGTEEQRTLAQFNGREAVGVNITKAQGYSTTAVSEQVLERVRALQGTLPEGVEFRVVQNAGERVESSVSNVQETLIEGAILTVLVVFLFLNSWRSTVITGLALPVSVLASFVAVWAYGFTLNTMSLLGLSLAIGILIDDAIVVRENIVRHVEMGKDHYTAAREGTAEIGLAVAATTFSIVVVFIPIGFMSGMAGQWFKPLALTIACSVLVSLFVSFSLDPMLSAYWADPELEDHQKSRLTRWLDGFNRWFDRQAEGYKRVIAWALDHRLAMVLIAAGSFFGALALPMVGLVGGEFFPVQDVSEFNVTVETPPGSNLAYTRLKAEEAAALARSHPEVAYTYTTIGGQSGSVDEANVYVRLHPKAERDVRQNVLEARLREQLNGIGGATAGVASGGFGGQKQIQIRLQGPDVETLNRLAEQVMGEVRQVRGAVDVGLSTKGQKPELDVVLDRGLAGSLGVTAGQVAQALRPAFAGIDVGDWIDPQNETRDVTVRLSPESRARVSDLETLPLAVQGPQGPVTLPLGQVARVEQSLGPAQINRLDRERVINVEANTQGRPLSEVVAEIMQRLERVPVPAGYVVSQGGEAEDQAEVFGQIFAALGLAVMLMYFVLVVQFGSFLDPLAIMLSLPLSLIGVMLALLLTGSTLNIMSMIGVILLMGLVAKNAILLIDFAKWSHEAGMPLREALIEAGRTRLRPILMTTFALVAGMLPVALGTGEGADFRAPLGRAVIGGVITSTFLTLLVIPTIYEILSEWRDWLLRRVFRRGGEPARPHAHAEPRPQLEPAFEPGD